MQYVAIVVSVAWPIPLRERMSHPTVPTESLESTSPAVA
jgi:hypothetical protein